MFRPFTAEWAQAMRDAVNNSAAYKEAAAKWTWPVALVVDANPAAGYPGAVAVELELDRGTCTAARAVDPAQVTADFVLRASLDTWKGLVDGSIDAVAAVAGGQVKLTGSMMTLMMHAKAAKALVRCARDVPITFDGTGT
ncbi:MAG: SCP2 sterol-binding domain-containing protein [Gemmatimonadetes bacterium]|nr:SCP2 sterol-binding domain-containing protein [Gemmatimonadota bacterium]